MLIAIREKQSMILNLKKNRFKLLEELESWWEWRKTKRVGI